MGANHLEKTAPVRLAVPTDVDAVVDVMLSAMPRDPTWDYRFSYHRDYPEDTLKYTTELQKLFIDPEYDDWEVLVVDAPMNEDPSVSKVVAFSVWDISYENRARHGPDYQPQDPPSIVHKNGGFTRRDANPSHMQAFREGGAEAKSKYFLSKFGTHRVHLQILGTHPDYMRRGYGTALCKCGIERAIKDNAVVTLNSSAEGFPLYTSLGFKDLGVVIFQAPGEEKNVKVRAMVYDPRSLNSPNCESDVVFLFSCFLYQ